MRRSRIHGLAPGVRAAAAAGLLLGLVTLVAVAGRTGIPWASAPSAPAPSPSGGASRTGALLLVLAWAALVAVGVVVRVRGRHARSRLLPPMQRRLRWFDRALVAVLALCFAAAVVAVLLAVTRNESPARPAGLAAKPAPTTRAHAARSTRPGYLGWLPEAGAGALLAVVVGQALLRGRPRRREGEPEPTAVTRAVSEALEDLRAESDPRRAVIAAYARMEQGMAAAGLGRRASDTPLEYLERVLGSLDAGRPSVRALTALFERAKFSRAAVRAADRDEAVAALVAIRADLQARS